MAHELTARDAAALERLLAQHPDDAVGTVLRLAWGEGLAREEIVRLTWDRVDLNALVLHLPAREVPLSEESARCLRARLRRGAAPETHVVRSDQRNAPLAPQSVSRLARAALDGAGLEAVGLRDLRADFIRRAFAAHDWAHALRLSGLSVTTYRNDLAHAAPPRAARGARDDVNAAFQLWQFLREHGETPAALAVMLAQQDLRAEEIAALTWAQVDAERGELVLPTRRVPLTAALRRALAARAEQAVDAPYVLSTPRTHRGMTGAELSAMVRTALIRAGLEDETLASLRRSAAQERGARTLVERARERGSITRAEAAALLGVSPRRAYRLLSSQTAAGTLTRVGAKYYPAGRVVPPAEQAAAIRAYLARSGPAYCQDLARVLGLSARVTARVLRALVARGELTLLRTKQYALPETGESTAANSGNVTK